MKIFVQIYITRRFMKTVLFAVLLALGTSASAVSQLELDQYCAQVGNTTTNLMFLDQLKGHVEGNDYIASFIPTELECKAGKAIQKPTNLKFVSFVDNDYADQADGGVNPYKVVPQVTKSNVNGQLNVSVRFVNGTQDLFADTTKTQRKFYGSIGFWFKTYAFYLIISKNNPARPALLLAH
jgi:hypothetical protein